MKKSNSVELLKNNKEDWNNQRIIMGIERPSFRNINFVHEFHGGDYYDLPEFYGLNFANSDMNMVSLRNCTFENCCFDGATITFSDLVDARFQSCTFRNVSMRVTKIGDATFADCLFEDSDLSYCSADQTSFKGTRFINTRLEHMRLVSNDFSNAILDGCYVYGISAWDLLLENTSQKSLVITKDDEPCITVDDIEVAQFIYLLINNRKLRGIIETISSKVILLLGNFSPERKRILDILRDELRKYDLLPVMFDFSQPKTKNFTETVLTLASMSKGVIADLTNQRSIPHELASIIPHHPSLKICPIIMEGETPYGMFSDFQSYPWVQSVFQYKEDNVAELVSHLVSML